MDKFTVDDFVVDTNQEKMKELLEIIQLVFNIKNCKFYTENEFFNLALNLVDKYIDKYKCKVIEDYDEKEWTNSILLILFYNRRHYIFTYCKSEMYFKFYIEDFNEDNVKYFIIDNECIFKISNINYTDATKINENTELFNDLLCKAIQISK